MSCSVLVEAIINAGYSEDEETKKNQCALILRMALADPQIRDIANAAGCLGVSEKDRNDLDFGRVLFSNIRETIEAAQTTTNKKGQVSFDKANFVSTVLASLVSSADNSKKFLRQLESKIGLNKRSKKEKIRRAIQHRISFLNDLDRGLGRYRRPRWIVEYD